MNVGIVGGGLMGSLLSWNLTKCGNQVDVFEATTRDSIESAAHVAASMLAPCSERIESGPRVWDLGIRSLGHWQELLHQIQIPHGLDGSIVIAHGSEMNLLRKFESALRDRYHVQDIESLDRTGLVQLEPELPSNFQYGVFLSNEGWLDNRALLAKLHDSSARFRYETATDPNSIVDQYDLVVDCRGAGAAGDEADLRAVRGEIVRVHAPEVELSRPIRLMHPKYQIYIAPRELHEYVIGATQLESNSKSNPTVQSVLELLSAAYTVHSGFAEAEIVEIASGLRAAYPDNEPRIRWRDSVLSVNGLYRHGYLIAPALVEELIHEIESAWTLSSTATA